MNQLLTLSSTAHVSSGAIAGMLFSMGVAVLGPIALLIIWRLRSRHHAPKDCTYLKEKCSVVPAFAGVATFTVAVLVLENIPKYFLFSGANSVSDYILNHAWAYAFTGALLAGIFEECGRFVTFRYFLKNYTARETAVTYGIGHGGMACLILLGVGMISNLSLAFMINNGSLAVMIEQLPQQQADAYELIIANLAASTFSLYLWSVWERIFAMLLHISLSVLVFAAVREKSKIYLFPLAILLHAGLDIFAALYQFGAINLLVTELLITLLSVGCAVFARRVYHSIDEK